jgi:hypothetical protein
MIGAGEDGHVAAGLGDDDLGDVPVDAGDRGRRLDGGRKRRDLRLDSGREGVQGCGQPVDPVRVQPDRERMLAVADLVILTFGTGVQAWANLTVFKSPR